MSASLHFFDKVFGSFVLYLSNFLHLVCGFSLRFYTLHDGLLYCKISSSASACRPQVALRSGGPTVLESRSIA